MHIHTKTGVGVGVATGEVLLMMMRMMGDVRMGGPGTGDRGQWKIMGKTEKGKRQRSAYKMGMG